MTVVESVSNVDCIHSSYYWMTIPIISVVFSINSKEEVTEKFKEYAENAEIQCNLDKRMPKRKRTECLTKEFHRFTAKKKYWYPKLHLV